MRQLKCQLRICFLKNLHLRLHLLNQIVFRIVLWFRIRAGLNYLLVWRRLRGHFRVLCLPVSNDSHTGRLKHGNCVAIDAEIVVSLISQLRMGKQLRVRLVLYLVVVLITARRVRIEQRIHSDRLLVRDLTCLVVIACWRC